MRSVGWVASLFAAFALGCGYDFGGGAGGEGAAGPGSSGSGSVTSFATVSGAGSASSGSASGVAATTVSAASVSSSSSGTIEPMGRCLDTLGNVFMNDFSVDGDPSWTGMASGLTSVARIEQGVARLFLGDQTKVSLQSVQLIAFTECSIEAHLVDPSEHFDSILIQRDAANYVGAFTYAGQWALDARSANVGVLPSVAAVPFAPWVRLRAEGPVVHFETSIDGVTYTVASDWQRAALPFLESTLNLSFTLQNDGAGADDEARWDDLNTMP